MRFFNQLPKTLRHHGQPAMPLRPLMGMLLMAILMALLSPLVHGVVMVDQGSPKALPPGHPLIGPNSPAVNPTPDWRRMALTQKLLDQNRTHFKHAIKLGPLGLLSIQNNDQLKIMDTWAEESLHTICGYNSINGQNPLYTALDMAFRPEAWMYRNFIFVETVPIRERLMKLVTGKAAKKRLLEQGTVSPAFLAEPAVQSLLNHMSSNAILNSALAQLYQADSTFQNLSSALRIVPPPPPQSNGTWHEPLELAPNTGSMAVKALPQLAKLKPIAGYTRNKSLQVVLGMAELVNGWRANKASQANAGIARLAAVLPSINPAAYPPRLKRHVEYWYDYFSDGTIVGVILYFLALTFFLISAVGGVPAMRRPAMAFFTMAVLTQAAFMGTRWWLAGRIPIQNEFESVLGSAFVGCVIGWLLELWKKNSLFGMAMSFVGFLAMTACFVVPFVLGDHIGANIGKVDGVLNTYWLYIHVNVIISSYALIAASFCMGMTYLGTKLFYHLHPVSGPAPSLALAGAGSGSGSGGAGGGGLDGGGEVSALELARRKFLLQLDSANIVILQMAFWFLGTGIILGAVWADYSWGRPWEWDPKETFSLLTWIIFLIIVHLRFVTPRYRPDWTAWLSVFGFAAMMFNWIGVNFFLVGLHSYAS